MKQIYRAIKYKYDFQQYETIRSFDKSIYTGKNTKMKVKRIKTIYQKIWQNLIINLDQKQIR